MTKHVTGHFICHRYSLHTHIWAKPCIFMAAVGPSHTQCFKQLMYTFQCCYITGVLDNTMSSFTMFTNSSNDQWEEEHFITLSNYTLQ